MQLTEFNLVPGENAIASNAMPLCRSKTDSYTNPFTQEEVTTHKNDCEDGYVGSTSNICGTMTEGGTYLMATDRSDVWKLGVCGMEWCGTDDFRMSGSPICGAVPGGAMFCGGNECYIYSDATESWTKTANMNTYHTYGNLITKNGSTFVIGGSYNDGLSVEKYDPATNTWEANHMDENGVNREYKGFTIADGPSDTFFTFEGYDCGNATGGCGFKDTSYFYHTSSSFNPGFFDSFAFEDDFSGWDITPQMEFHESHLYKTFASRYDDDSQVLFHAQRYVCGGLRQWNDPNSWEFYGAGSLLDLAQGLGADMSAISAAFTEQVDGPCKNKPADADSASFIEVEFYTYAGDYWSEPNMAWSPTVGGGVSYANVFAFFWDESNLKDQDTCYVNLCGAEHNPCDDGQECAWEWNKDTMTTSVTCDGEGKL